MRYVIQLLKIPKKNICKFFTELNISGPESICLMMFTDVNTLKSCYDEHNHLKEVGQGDMAHIFQND